MSDPNTPSLIELYDAVKAIATQHPTKISLGELRQSQAPGGGLLKGEMMQSCFGIVLGDEHYGTSLNLRGQPNGLVNVNIIEWSQTPLRNALGAGTSPRTIIELIRNMAAGIDPDNPPKAKMLLEKLFGIHQRIQREAQQTAKKDLQAGSLCA